MFLSFMKRCESGFRFVMGTHSRNQKDREHNMYYLLWETELDIKGYSMNIGCHVIFGGYQGDPKVYSICHMYGPKVGTDLL